MVNTSFDLELEKDGKKETVKVVLQEVSPFISANIFSSALDVQSGNYKIGTVVEQGIKELVVSPKNLTDKISESDKPMEAISKLFLAIQSFCDSPKRFSLLQKESKTKSKSVERSDS